MSSFTSDIVLPRRRLLQIGGAGMLGLTLPKLLRSEDGAKVGPTVKPRAKSVIFLFQWGGPSHIDMFDRKPNAPSDIRGPLKSISSTCPGLEMCEQLPQTAKRMDKVTVIRTLTHTMKNHNSAGYYALSGHPPPSDDQRLRDSLDLFPAYGSVVDKLAPNSGGMPTFSSRTHTPSVTAASRRGNTPAFSARRTIRCSSPRIRTARASASPS